jgi:hypothetical protein
MLDLCQFYDERTTVKNEASLINECDESTEIVITVYDIIMVSTIRYHHGQFEEAISAIRHGSHVIDIVTILNWS